MSMNIHVEGNRNATVIVKGKKKKIIDTIDFDCFQTPTSVTNNIVSEKTNESKISAYIAFVESLKIPDERVKVFADDDLFGERPPIRIDIENVGQIHIEKFREFLQHCEKEDYTVKFLSH